EDLRVTVGRLIQDELGPLRAVGVEAHVVEEKGRVPRNASGRSQEARGNDAVRVDVGQIERGRDRGESREGLHQCISECTLVAATTVWQAPSHAIFGAELPRPAA